MAKEISLKGTVLAAGTGRTDDDGKRTKMDGRTDDVVFYFTDYVAKIKIDDMKLFVIKESDI